VKPTRIHHVQITVSPEQVNAARDFYCGVIGLAEIEKPDTLKGRGGFWTRLGHLEIHVGIEDKTDFPPTKAHIAYEVENLADWRQHLVEAGVEISESVPIPEYDRFEFRDPFGNRVELIQPKI
jgi:catechol 2,3-dioxygenase-like lactoylglutathione lyase family enzyme